MFRLSILNYSVSVLLLLDKTAKIQSLVYGTPVENCRSMIPQHDYNLPQWMDPPPYNLSASVILSNTTTTQFNGNNLQLKELFFFFFFFLPLI